MEGRMLITLIGIINTGQAVLQGERIKKGVKKG
jgi:hypothetical protein